jgi:hypothetical protein
LPLAKQKHIQIMINWTHICQNTTHFYRHYDKQSRLSVFTWILMHFVLVRNITVFTLWETEQIVCFLLNLDVLVRTITKGPGELLPSLGVRRLLSVVCKLFTFQASSPKPLGQLDPNLAGMFLGWSSTRYCFSFQSDIQHGCQAQ